MKYKHTIKKNTNNLKLKLYSKSILWLSMQISLTRRQTTHIDALNKPRLPWPRKTTNHNHKDESMCPASSSFFNNTDIPMYHDALMLLYLSINSERACIKHLGSKIVPTLGSSIESTGI